MSYIATLTMNPERITVGSLVYVPVWRTGQVIGWDYGHVVEIQNPENDAFYIVCLMSAQTYNGKKQGYYGYSLACGICHDRDREDTSKCFQCFPGDDVDHAECHKDFPTKAAQGIDVA